MTRDRDFKRIVRARIAASGERYTAARAALLRHGKEDGMVRVTVEVRVEKAPPTPAEAPDDKIEETFRSLADPGGKPLLLLSEVGGTRLLPIYCGPVEATSVAFALQGIVTPRPMTHDLLRDVVSAMGTAREVRITDVKDATFFAELIVVDSAGQERTVSCRPSDGIALAVRADIPILVNEDLFPEGTDTAAEA